MNGSSPHPAPGETFAGKYLIERELGQGGMGVVLLARHIELDEPVAIKFLLKTNDLDAIARFSREARAAAKVKSEHVARVHDVGRTDSDVPYIVMEYLAGVDLARKLKNEGPQPVELVALWMIEACEAIAAAHAVGIVHRDLKPENIFLSERDDGSTCTKVLDFGVSKLPAHSVMTNAASLVGTPIYMSPEQIANSRDVDGRADVWSLGATIYELLTGVAPFAADSLLALINVIVNREPRPVGELRADLPAPFADLVMRCLRKTPDERPATIVELVQGLAPYAPSEAQAIVSRVNRLRISSPGSSKRGADLAKPTKTPSGDAPISSDQGRNLDVSLALARTHPHSDEALPPSSQRSALAHSTDALKSDLATTGDAPVERTLQREPPSSSRSWLMPAIAGMAVATAVVLAVLRISGPAPNTAPPAVPGTSERVVTTNPPAASESIPPPARTADPRVGPVEAHPTKESAPTKVATEKKTNLPAPVATAASAKPAPVPAPAPSASTPDIDRDNPFSH